MFKTSIALASAAALAAGVAHAADKPIVAPAPDWVKPSAVSLTAPAETKDAAVGPILEDLQLEFTPKSETLYTEVIVKVQTPQGLTELGTLAPAWNPDTDQLTIHKVHLIRDGKVIDVLAGGKGFTVLRRETKLEEATLDGSLTAAMQIEDLRVGDILDFAWTLERADPVLAGRAQDDVFLNASPGGRVRLRLLWPDKEGVRTRASAWSPPLHFTTTLGLTEASLKIDDAPEVVVPKGAPTRFLRGREVEVSNFATWADVSALMAPLFNGAAQIEPGSPLEAEEKRIAVQSGDPKERAAAALSLVQNQVRYVLLALNGGGLKPAAADLTWSRRFGDCKGKTALLLALLKGLGVNAEPALVSTAAGDGLDQRLPTLLVFDHVIVHAMIAGKDYWMDGTRAGDTSLDAIRIPPFRWTLPIRASGAQLTPLLQTPLAVPDGEIILRLDASKGLSAPAQAHAEIVLRGDAAQQTHMNFVQVTAAQREQALKSFWSSQYSFIDAKSVDVRFDAAKVEERFTLDGTATMDWSGNGYEADGARLTSKPDFERRPSPHQDAPYTVGFPIYETVFESIVLPNGGAGFAVSGADVDETVGGTSFSRKATIKGGVFTLEVATRSLEPEFPAADEAVVAAKLTDLSQSTVFVAPPGVAASGAESSGFAQALDSGRKALNGGRYAEAIADLGKAAMLDPKSAEALGLRAIGHSDLGQWDAARQDDNLALVLDAKDENALIAQGDIAAHDTRWTAAIVAYTQAADAVNGDSTPRLRRVAAYVHSGDFSAALADCEDALKDFPQDQHLHVFRGNLLIRLSRPAEAIAEASAIAASNPKDALLQMQSADILWNAGRKVDARLAADRAIALEPTAMSYLASAALRDRSDLDGLAADSKAALALAPDSQVAMGLMARVERRRGNYAEARKWMDRLIKSDPRNIVYLTDRADDDLKLGNIALADSELAEARRLGQSDANALNEVCWTQAIDNYHLDRALADCDAAIKLAPKAGQILDSRAFVLLRLNRNDEALVQYGEALAVFPQLAPSLYGRSIAERREGRDTEADRDLKAATALDPDIAHQFKDFGIVQ